MDDDKILSNEEKDAMRLAGQQVDAMLSDIFSSERRRYERSGQEEILDCIVAALSSEFEKGFSSFIRKKVSLSFSKREFGSVHQFVVEESKDKVFNLYYVHSGNYFCLIILDLVFLHQIMNVLFGGRININDSIIETSGKMGLIISEKISAVMMDAFSLACRDYGEVDYRLVKSSTLPILVTRMAKESRVYSIISDVLIDSFRGQITLLVTADYIYSMSAEKSGSVKETEDVHTRESIENIMLNSEVTLSAVLPEVSVTAAELIRLKAGDLLPISSPSNVFITSNEKKIFSGVSGQSNSTIVVKLIEKL